MPNPNFTLPSIEILVIVFIVTVLVEALAIYVAARVVTDRGTGSRAIFVAIVAPIYFYVVLLVLAVLFGLFLGFLGVLLAVLIAFLALVHFFATSYKTGMGRGFLIAVLAVILFLVIEFVLSVALNFAPLI